MIHSNTEKPWLDQAVLTPWEFGLGWLWLSNLLSIYERWGVLSFLLNSLLFKDHVAFPRWLDAQCDDPQGICQGIFGDCSQPQETISPLLSIDQKSKG